jgi:AraC-like DNA-binding protein
VDYHEYAPHVDLEQLVRCFWTLNAPANRDELPAPALPDGCPELIFNLGDPIRAHTPEGLIETQPATMLVGQITRPFVVAPMGRIDIAAARFTAFGASILTPDMARLTNRWTNAAELHEELRYTLPRLASVTDTPGRANIIEDSLRRIAGERPAPNPTVVRTVDLISRANGAIDIAALANKLGTTARNLQRLFRAHVGIPPKLLCRIRRFQRVFAAWRDTPDTWAAVAAECGYFDQAHLVRDFSELGGGPPAGLVARLPEFTRLFTALHHPAS